MLRDLPGIHAIKVALLAERGVVEYDPKSWNPDKLITVSSFTLFSSYTTLGTWSGIYGPQSGLTIALAVPCTANGGSKRETRDVLA